MFWNKRVKKLERRMAAIEDIVWEMKSEARIRKLTQGIVVTASGKATPTVTTKPEKTKRRKRMTNINDLVLGALPTGKQLSIGLVVRNVRAVDASVRKSVVCASLVRLRKQGLVNQVGRGFYEKAV